MKHRLKANWHLFRGVARRVMRANISLVAAGGAFFAMLSLFPALAAGIALLGFLVNPSVVDQQLAMLSEFIPPDAFQLIDGQVRRLVAANNSTLGWTTLISTGAVAEPFRFVTPLLNAAPWACGPRSCARRA